MAAGRPLGAKLFLEGVEVPFLGATITCSVGQASIAYVDVVPHKEINNVKPRTHIMLAVRDYNNPEEDYPYVQAWEGEVYGYSFGKTPGSRSFTLQCIDLSSYWDNALSYFLNPVASLGKGGADIVGLGLDRDAATKAGIPLIATSAATVSYLYQLVKEQSTDGDFLKGFTAAYKAITKINEFYQSAEKRLRIADRIILKSSGKLSQLLDQQQAFEWFSGMMGKTAGGGFATLRSVIQDMMSVIFHDFCPVPFPAGVPKDGLVAPSAAESSSDTKKKKNTTVGQFIFKPNLYMVPPPVCNIFFPDEYSNFQFSRNFFQESTRLIYKPELPFYLGGGVALPYQFEPPSLQHFMTGKQTGDLAPSSLVGEDDIQIHKKMAGFFGDELKNEFTEVSNNIVREGQFLTNEERMKGIWMAQETMMPATTSFTQGVDDPSRRSLASQVAKYLFFKKRFETRQLQITSHLKLSVVPGFNVLLLDAGDSEQSTLAYCSSVTHRIYSTEGGYTNVQLSYARSVQEENVASSNGNDPIIPPWYDEKIFGAKKPPPPSKAAGSELSSKGTVLVTPTDGSLSQYFSEILGASGSKSITDYFKEEPTVLGATKKLLQDYDEHASRGTESLQTFISKLTGRDYIRIRDAFSFIRATLESSTSNTVTTNTGSAKKTTDIRNSQFNVFKDGAFSTDDANYGDIMEKKLKVINAYRDTLQKYRGFRG